MALFGESGKLEKFRLWRQLHPRKFWLIVGLTVGTVLLLSLTVFARAYTFKKTISYPPCQIEYGNTVAEWDGKGEDLWNEQGYHYVTKHFLVKATAPRQLFPKVAEVPPNTLETGKLDGSPGCQPDFNGLVDSGSDSYQWYGAKAMAARLGTPALGEVNQDGRINSDDPRLKPAGQLSPPLFGNSHARAAAWVDDGAQAVIQSQDRAASHLLWCQGQNQPVEGDGSCNNLGEPPEGQLPLRGNGYLFTADNCPLDNCQGVDGWYTKPATRADTDYSSVIGTNERGELQPFYLHLSAVSTYANTIGTWMTMSLKYPVSPQLTNAVATNPNTVPAGGIFDVTLTISKIGPDVSGLVLNAIPGLQPVEEVAAFGINEETLSKLNNNQQVNLTARYKLTGGQPGQCFDLPFNLEAIATSPNPDPIRSEDPHKVTAENTVAHYCVQQPNPQASYTYEVNSRGGIQSDLNEFIAQAGETLASSLGWPQAGASFSRVATGGDFTLVLSSPDQMSSFSSGCDATYSCRAGRFVVINDERWRTATPSWNSAGGSLRDYRHMVINHEVGHWLGFGHLQCPAAGAPAPVMQQQSISLQGCAFNPWPTPPEIATLKARL